MSVFFSFRFWLAMAILATGGVALIPLTVVMALIMLGLLVI